MYVLYYCTIRLAQFFLGQGISEATCVINGDFVDSNPFAISAEMLAGFSAAPVTDHAYSNIEDSAGPLKRMNE